MRAFDAACSRAWVITEDALQGILEIAARENPSIEAVEQKLGRPLDNSHAVTVRDGVANIPVQGPIFRHANLITQISGATSVETLAQDFRQALDDPSIKGIVFDIDSPGGEVAGIHEFADAIHAARGTKPIIAYVDDYGASAAYWIASAADEVIASATAHIGSIGVVAAVRDPTSKSSRSIEFVSSQSPNKRIDPTTKDGKTQIQAMVDELADVFVGSVARNRGVSTDKVLSDFGQGGIFIGQSAVKAGLADRLGSHEQAIIAARSPKRASLPLPLAAKAEESTRPAAKEKHSTGGRYVTNKFSKWFGAGQETRELARESGADVPSESEMAIVAAAVEAEREKVRAEESARHAEKQKEADAQLAEARNQLFQATAQRLQGEASAFADGLIIGSKLLPAEREGLIAALTTAGLDDASHGAVTFANGTSGSRVEQLKAMYSARPLHGLTQEQAVGKGPFSVIQGGQEASADPKQVTPEGKTPTKERIEYLTSLAGGQQKEA